MTVSSDERFRVSNAERKVDDGQGQSNWIKMWLTGLAEVSNDVTTEGADVQPAGRP
jgi:hypothetical protein